MTVNSPRIRSLLRQADNVAAAGKRAAAEQLYLQIVDEAPDTAEAWRGLAQVAKTAEDRDSALSRAQELDPGYTPSDQETDNQNDPGEGELQDKSEVISSSFSGDGQVIEGQSTAPVAKPEAIGPLGDADHIHAYNPVDAGANEAVENTESLFCANHPGRQTHLRCNRCGKPICSSCANPTPVGYRCPECIREQEDVYFTATPIDYVLTTFVVLPLSLVVGWIATLVLASILGFFLIFLGAFTGSLMGRVAFRVAGRRRGRWLPQLTVACVVIGGVLPALILYGPVLLGLFGFRLIFLGIYLFTAAGATYYQMR